MNGIDKWRRPVMDLTGYEADVLTLQELFLRPGVHTLPNDSLPFARELVFGMLDSLGCYAAPSYLAVAPQEAEYFLMDNTFEFIYDTLCSFSDGPAIMRDSIDRYLLQAFFSDFCCIEETPALIATEWYEHFKQRLHDFDIAARIPVIIIPACT